MNPADWVEKDRRSQQNDESSGLELNVNAARTETKTLFYHFLSHSLHFKVPPARLKSISTASICIIVIWFPVLNCVSSRTTHWFLPLRRYISVMATWTNTALLLNVATEIRTRCTAVTQSVDTGIKQLFWDSRHRTAACGVTVTHHHCWPASHTVPGSFATSDLSIGEDKQKHFLSGNRAGRQRPDPPFWSCST